MDDPDDLQLVGIVPALCDDVFASADVKLRVHLGQQAVAPGADARRQQLEQPPRVDIDGEGVFTLLAVSLESSGAAELCWCTVNIPDYEFGLGHQVVSYQPPSTAGPCRLVFMLYRQRGDGPIDMTLTHSPHKFDEAAAPTDRAAEAERRGFDAKQLAARYHLGRPVAVHWVQCLPAAT